MALFFFPRVGVVDDEVVEREGPCGFFRCDEAVDGLCFPSEGVGGRAAQVVVRVMVRVASG